MEIETKRTQRQEKRRKNALITVKYMPYLMSALLVAMLLQSIQYYQHPKVETVLHLLHDLGIVLFAFTYWQKARGTLRNIDTTPYALLMASGAILIISGQFFADWHYAKLMSDFSVMGTVVAVIVLYFFALFVYETVKRFKKTPMLPAAK